MKKVVSVLITILVLLILISCGKKRTLPEHLQFEELNSNEFAVTGYNPDLPKDVVLPEVFMGRPVTKIGKNAFKGSKLRTVTIPESYTSIDENAFFSATYLKEVTFLGKSKVTEIGDSAFWGNLSLSKITIPKSVIKIGEFAFYENVSLKNVIFEADGNLNEIGDLAFSKNYSLKTIKIPKTVNILGNAVFSRSSGLDSILVDQENPKYTSVDGVLYNKNKTVLISYPLAKSDIIFNLLSTVNEISNNAFYEAINLEEVVTTNNLVKIGDYAFTNIKSLKRIVLSDSVNIIGMHAFRDSTNLVIFTEHDYEQPLWAVNWNSSSLRVYYKNTWHYNNINQPVPND